jgi:phasin family protein
MQRTISGLTGPLPLPRMGLLRRTMRPALGLQKNMNATAQPFALLGASALESGARFARLSMDSAERVVAIQLAFVKGSMDLATRNAKAAAGAKDVQEYLATRTRNAESALERFAGYSRELYEVASDAQAELSKLTEQRIAEFQKLVAQGVDQAVASAPAGSGAAATAIKSGLAAATAAYDTLSKAARHATSFTDASVKAATPGRRAKK